MKYETARVPDRTRCAMCGERTRELAPVQFGGYVVACRRCVEVIQTRVANTPDAVSGATPLLTSKTSMYFEREVKIPIEPWYRRLFR